MKKILIVDDEPDTLLFIKDGLEFEGFEVVTAVDGQEGIKNIQDKKPDLILLDVMMPKMDGYAVCRFLKFHEDYKQIPIILLTARAQEKDKEIGRQVGADDYLTKPFDFKSLLEKIKSFLGP